MSENLTSIEQKIKQIISEHLGTNVSEISHETNLMSDLNADSLDIVELIMVFEDTFSVEISDNDVENLKTVGDIISYIGSKQ